MSKVSTILKTQKPKTNNFVLILEQFLKKYNLLADSTPEQLSEHVPELGASLLNWKACKCIKGALVRSTKNRHMFSKEKIEALVPDQKKSNRKLTIDGRAKFCTKNGDIMNIFAYHLDLGLKNCNKNEIVASNSRQSQFHMKLEEAGVSPEIINTYTKDKNFIQESNKIQREQTKKRMASLNRIPIYFSLARITKRLQSIDITKEPTMQNLADVIVMLSMRPTEVRSLQISHYEPNSSEIPAWYKNGYS